MKQEFEYIIKSIMFNSYVPHWLNYGVKIQASNMTPDVSVRVFVDVIAI